MLTHGKEVAETQGNVSTMAQAEVVPAMSSQVPVQQVEVVPVQQYNPYPHFVQTPIAATPAEAATKDTRVVTASGYTLGAQAAPPQYQYQYPPPARFQYTPQQNQQGQGRGRGRGGNWNQNYRPQGNNYQSGPRPGQWGNQDDGSRRVIGTGYLRAMCNLCRNKDHNPETCERTQTQFKTMYDEIFGGKMPSNPKDLPQ
jgi:hypothetical protein